MPILLVKAKPNARTSALTLQDDGTWLAQLKSAPVDGKANAALAALFASIFSIPKRAVELLSGDTSRLKRIKLHGVPAETAAAVVARLTHDT